ncbi:CesT family type III secretion system chaperone [Chromobacterium piscinae]|uniref:CesT family type III secretion system chaperone n=1 Tax=Chromobacterium piscinae TaxID=686831 RepID=UPI001C8BC704|nr:CesT family type III secretion system chaperone [Chromobacterium piscinae]MBX9295518.1 CesT family type III secretion system chaperone [Chromobacterium vaccinii]MBX9355826.1 CesT family type III secretion system chaperone [Chromobacterium vaccinii]MCD4505101.1 CesT family type III secretion system chaperone [Chromobacterium piscinae]MCD5326517.1 CesT family type III secretion system chaperone [Chromobacterium piscinae]
MNPQLCAHVENLFSKIGCSAPNWGDGVNFSIRVDGTLSVRLVESPADYLVLFSIFDQFDSRAAVDFLKINLINGEAFPYVAAVTDDGKHLVMWRRFDLRMMDEFGLPLLFEDFVQKLEDVIDSRVL